MTKTKPSITELMSTLLTWTQSPDMTSLPSILESFTDSDLLAAASASSNGSAAGRIVWLEYARRREFLDFDLQTSVLGDTVHLKASAPALPIHEGVLLGTRKTS